jgi:hypothetical protein
MRMIPLVLSGAEAMAETLEHPILGVLEWEAEYGYWFTQYQLPDGEWLDLTVDPGDGDRYGFLKRAADLFLWALKNERRLLREAIEAELLELYNDTWRQDEPVLDAEDFEAGLEWHFLALSASEIVPVVFSYGAGEMFGGHSVDVELDAELTYLDVDLVG